MVLPRFIASCTWCLAALAAAGAAPAQSAEPDEPDNCTPAESAHCAGQAYQQALQRLNAVVEAKVQKLVQSLPEEPFDRINLPSKASLQALHRSWRGYVQSYCNVYWYLWPGASTWKSAESVECQAEAHRRYEVFLDRVQACTASDDACHLLACTPWECKVKKP